jgi:outer membrane biosynthesis protein TonB
MSTVQRVAAQYEAELSRKCESTDELKGEVTVRMQVDADGKVTHTQVSSTIGKPKIAACIAMQVKKWTFPRRPGEPIATATYSVVFQ